MFLNHKIVVDNKVLDDLELDAYDKFTFVTLCNIRQQSKMKQFPLSIPLIAKAIPCSEKRARNSIANLHGKEYIQTVRPNNLKEKIFALIKGKQHRYSFAPYSYFAMTCTLCNGDSFILESHHFPTSKKNGGEETIDICPNCHREYHSLLNRKWLMLNKRQESLIDYLEE